MTVAVGRASRRTSSSALSGAVVLAIVLWFSTDDELFTTTSIAIIAAAIGFGFVLLVWKSTRPVGLGIALGALAAAPLYLAALYALIAFTGPLGG